jgi:uncharacterized membrane protein
MVGILRSADGTTYTYINVPGRTDTVLTGINDNGEILGYSMQPAPVSYFLLGADLSTYNFLDFRATGLNDLGQTAGFAENQWNQIMVRNADGSTYLLPAPEVASLSISVDINNSGQILGNFSDAFGFHHAFLMSADGSTVIQVDFPGIPNQEYFGTFAAGINDSGEIVGTYIDPRDLQTHGFLRSPDGTYTHLDFPELGQLLGLNDINNNGQILGHAAAGVFIATPVADTAPEPSTSILFGTGLLGLTFWMRRRRA